MAIPSLKLGKKKRTRLGTFGGVFTPSILTILGIILFLRTGYVVGLVGLANTLMVILAANVISVLTSLSLAAVATQMRVKGGGFYYLISRTLGIEFGGALGLILFLSISISIAFYAIGLGEVVVQMFPVPDYVTARRIAIIVVLFLFAFAWIGADWATRLQYLVMGFVVAALVAFFWGGFQSFEFSRLHENWELEGNAPFWIAFALFFPAITGFTQGVNMSGDLQDPERAIPLGTLTAVGLSIITYIAVAIVLAGTADQDLLRDDYLVMEQISAIGWLIAAGVIAATSSSAMASFLGAPRVMQALARDRVFPYLQFLGKGFGTDDNPRRAVVLSALIALGAVALGDLNFLAPIITMFFLASYALLNYATYFVADAASPSFRPSFKLYHKYVSLLGALACIGAALAINWTASLIAISLIFGIYEYLRRTAEKSLWSDSKRAYGFQRIRDFLFEIDALKAHPRDWRPQILALSKDKDKRRQLLCFAAWIEGNSGLTTLITILEREQGDQRDRYQVMKELREEIQDAQVNAFPLAVEASDFRTGIGITLQAYGVGPIKANTILLNWLEERSRWFPEESEKIYGHNIEVALRGGFNTVILAAQEKSFAKVIDPRNRYKRIDIWWVGGATSPLMLILAYLMTRKEPWRHAQLRVLAQGQARHPDRTEWEIREFLKESRIEAEVKIVSNISIDVVTDTSADTPMVFFPIKVVEDRPRTYFDIDLDEVIAKLPLVVLVIAGSDIELTADPDVDLDKEDSSAPSDHDDADQDKSRSEQ